MSERTYAPQNYNVAPIKRVSPFTPPTPPPVNGFWQGLEDSLQTSWIEQVGSRFITERLMNTPDPSFNAWDHLEGYEEFAEDLVATRSKAEMDAMKSRLDKNRLANDRLLRNPWAFTSGIASQVFDPSSYIPVPIAKGIGFVKGALVVGTGNIAISAGTESARIAFDPTSSWDELPANIGAAALFGTVVGGVAGSLSPSQFRQSNASVNSFISGLNASEGMNTARAFNAANDGYVRDFGRTGVAQNGEYVPIVIRQDSETIRAKDGIDGNRYWHDDTAGWILASERGTPAPYTPVAPNVVAELGTAPQQIKKTIVVDDAYLKVEYHTGNWRMPQSGVTPLPQDLIRNADEYVDFRQYEAAWKERLPQKANESAADYQNRVQSKAVAEFEGSRLSAKPGAAFGAEEYLSRLNLSPVALAHRMFPDDNVLGELPLAVGGDYGWSIRSNAAGIKTPSSVLIRVHQYNGATAQLVGKIQEEWLKFVRQDSNAQGKKMFGQNISASAERLQTRGRNIIGQRSLQFTDFAEMAGRAVFEDGPFKVNGFDVVPEAREVAKAFTRLAQKTDDEALELGIFASQKGFQRTIQAATTRIESLQNRMSKWLWSSKGNPSNRPGGLEDVIQISDGRVFKGLDHNEAIFNMLSTLGNDGPAFLTGLKKGYIQRGKTKFINYDDIVNSRVNSLTNAQRLIYDDMIRQMTDLETSKINAENYLKIAEEPHHFVNQFGKKEPYFPRFWHKPNIMVNRLKFEALLESWYRSTGLDEPAARAVRTVDNMLTSPDASDGEAGIASGLRHLSSRELKIPNSYKINHQTFGEVSISDFIETNLEVVSQQYLRKMGVRLEMAKKFGDTAMWEKLHEVEDYWRDRYMVKLNTVAEIKAARARFDEYKAHLTNVAMAVNGTLKTRDPWAMDNRIARAIKSWTQMSTMGRVLYTVIPETMRSSMVNGFANTFNALWTRMYDDFAVIRKNHEFMQLTGEISDFVLDRHNRLDEINNPIGAGGTKYERALQELVPGYFKIVGLTPWTVIAKDLTMFTTQHVVMDHAIKIAKAVNDGKPAPQKLVKRLAALGVSEKDALLLASMPFERKQGGRLILPSVDKWANSDGAHARRVLLDALAGQSRRTIITPSVADLPTIFQGVLTRKGERLKVMDKTIESDLLTLPLQFLAYGVSASQKLVLSSLQGRDVNSVSGAVAMLALGFVGTYMRTPENAMRHKDYRDLLLESYEASGVGGFIFSDLNQMIERYSRNTVGLRPLLGMDPRFGRTSEAGDYVDAFGPGPGLAYDLSRAFWDEELSNTNRAQMVRRAILYNNVIWWGHGVRDLTSAVTP